MSTEAVISIRNISQKPSLPKRTLWIIATDTFGAVEHLDLLSEDEGVGVCKILKEKEYEVLVGDRELAIPLNIEFIP